MGDVDSAEKPPGPEANSTRPTWYDLAPGKAGHRCGSIDPHWVRRLRHFLLRMFLPVEVALGRLPSHVARSLQMMLDVRPIELVNRRDSADDGSCKLLMRLSDSELVEAVLLRAHTGRTTACVSSQVGCNAGCHFCATASLGFRRSLTVAEMLEQIRIAGQIAREDGRLLRNIVFMGMGEPLDNLAELSSALHQISSDHGFAIPARRVTVSTVGIPDAMCQFVDRHPRVQIAFSLHSAKPAVRARLIPLSRRYDWDELRDAVCYVAKRHVNRPSQGPMMIEYLMLDGVNDQWDDAEALINYLRGIPAHINLIPYNPIAGRPQWRASPREVRDAFAQRLRDAGFFTTVRFSMGSDIAAACGQLALQGIQHQ